MKNEKNKNNQTDSSEVQPNREVALQVALQGNSSATTFDAILQRMKIATNTKTDTGFAKVMGLRQSSVSGAKARGSPPSAWAIEVANKTGVSLDWLIFGEERRSQPPLMHAEGQGKSSPELVMVPKVKAKLNAGGGSLVTSDEITGRFAFRHDWIKAKGDPSKMVLMDVFGESMEPVIWDGDTVLIDQSQTDLIPGRIYALGVEDSVVVKYVEMEPGKLILRSANRQWKDIEVDTREDQADTVKIIGRVIWWCREAR